MTLGLYRHRRIPCLLVNSDFWWNPDTLWQSNLATWEIPFTSMEVFLAGNCASNLRWVFHCHVGFSPAIDPTISLVFPFNIPSNMPFNIPLDIPWDIPIIHHIIYHSSPFSNIIHHYSPLLTIIHPWYFPGSLVALQVPTPVPPAVASQRASRARRFTPVEVSIAMGDPHFLVGL